jgi:hypothetical protein
MSFYRKFCRVFGDSLFDTLSFKPGKTTKGNGLQVLYLTTVPMAIGVIVTHNGRLYNSSFATNDR